MNKRLSLAFLVATMVIFALVGLTVSAVSAQNAVSISDFHITPEREVRFHLNNLTSDTSLKFHVYLNGDFTEWGLISVVNGEQDIAFALVNQDTQINNAEIVLLKDSQEDVRLASAFWNGQQPTPEPTSTPVPSTPEPTAQPTVTTTPTASEITYQVITQTIRVSLTAPANWHLYLDGTFSRYGHGTEFVIGLAEFSQSMEVITNPGNLSLERKLFVRRNELFDVLLPLITR